MNIHTTPGRHDDPVISADPGHTPLEDPGHRPVEAEPTVPFNRHAGTRVPIHGSMAGDADATDRPDPTDVVEELRKPDNQARLLLAIAIMSLATLILAVVITAAVAADDEPVMVDGVPCLVQDGPNGEAILYCQR